MSEEGKEKEKQYYIYKLTHKNEEIKHFYIGSTTNIRDRKYRHYYNSISAGNTHYGLFVYRFIRETGGFDEWNFEILETRKYIDRIEQRISEQKYITDLNPYLNSKNESVTREETLEKKRQYYHKKKQENPELINEKQRINSKKRMEDEEYAEKIREQNKAAYEKRMEDADYAEKEREKNRERVRVYSALESTKEHKKEYNALESTKELKKEYYLKNKEKVHQKSKERYKNMNPEQKAERKAKDAAKYASKTPEEKEAILQKQREKRALIKSK